MDVFISWSGERSRIVAKSLRTWLSDIIQVLTPWMSSEDIRGGARWGMEVTKRLEKAKFGIICLTRENIEAPWIHFEAGAIAKSLETAAVCPYLLDIKQSDLQGPLVQFQALAANKSDTLKLVESLNKSLGEDARPDGQLVRLFETLWPKLESVLSAIPASASSRESLRTERELLEELLERVRFPSTLSGLSMLERGLGLQFGSLDDFLSGAEVESVQARLETLATLEDEPFGNWQISQPPYRPGELDGEWWSRWEGGTTGKRWKVGLAFIRTAGNYLYIHHHDDFTDYLALSHAPTDSLLRGRYVNVLVPDDSTPWAARIIDKNYIKGFWGQGRWELRRAEESPVHAGA